MSERLSFYALGLGFGMLTALAVFLICWLAGRGKDRRKYDERQLAAQGRAAKAAFFTNLIYAAACIVVFGGVEPGRGVAMLAMFLGALLSVGVYAILCILHDAYFNLSDSPRKTLGVMGMITALQFVNFITNCWDAGLFPDGAPNFIACTSLSTGVMLLLVIAVSLVKLAADRRRGERDEES